MPRYIDPQGRFIKTPPQIEIESSNTPVTGNPIIEELAEKQRIGQRLTLIKRQTLLAWEATQKQSSISRKQKEIIKGKQHVFPSINPLIFQQPETPLKVETNQPMAEEGHGSVIFTPEQRAEYDRQKREWRRKREEEAKQENDREIENDRKRQEDGNDEEATFGFPIVDTSEILGEEVKMKNIPPSVLPNFYGMSTEDPDAFMFEFDILCRTYGYTNDIHKLHLFPATLKAAALKWFMGLGEQTIASCDDMRSIFLKEYQPYCRSRDSKEDVFRMTQQEDENLEEYSERFAYNLQKSKQHSLNQETIRTIFLNGVRDEYLDSLNVMGKGDISNIPFEEIAELCQKYSRGRSKIGKREASSKAAKSAAGGITRAEIGSLLENFKTDLLSTLGTQVDVLKANKKKEEQEQALAIFCSKCRKKHPLRECPLDSIQVCGLCTENHSTENCLRLKELQLNSMEEVPGIEGFYYVAPRRPWQPRMPQQNQQQFPQQNYLYPPQNPWTPPMPWQAWPPQKYSQQPAQGWRGYGYGNQPPQQYHQQYQQQYQQPFTFPQYSQSMPFQQQHSAYPQSMPFPQQSPPPMLT